MARWNPWKEFKEHVLDPVEEAVIEPVVEWGRRVGDIGLKELGERVVRYSPHTLIPTLLVEQTRGFLRGREQAEELEEEQEALLKQQQAQAEARFEAEEEREAALRRRERLSRVRALMSPGRPSTLLTSPLGAIGEPTMARRTLLGA